MLLRVLLTALLLSAGVLKAVAPVYVVLWFDTEDYIDPAADDAALRIASDLSKLGVRATFKVVGEKARVLEQRKRTDVIRALSQHDIGYHSDFHSVHPTPAEYLQRLGYLEGAEEFLRRERAGIADIQRVFGVLPSCYGQPGSSWGPQSHSALLKAGIPVYLDEGSQVGLDNQAFWYGGLLNVFNMGKNQFRAQLDAGPEDAAAYGRFDEATARLRASGGGLISIYYHPTEFVNQEFWDAVNFSKGANPPRPEWKRPRARTPEEQERCYGVLRKFVAYMKGRPGVQFITARDLLKLYRPQTPASVKQRIVAEHFSKTITYLATASDTLSAADLLLQLMGLPPQVVNGPAVRKQSTWRSEAIPRPAFDRAVQDARDFVVTHHRLPNEVFLGAETLALPDFAATLAQSVLVPDGPVSFRVGKVAFEQYFATDAAKSFNWIIHPDGFAPNELLELARLQGWTLKPARLLVQ